MGPGRTIGQHRGEHATSDEGTSIALILFADTPNGGAVLGVVAVLFAGTLIGVGVGNLSLRQTNAGSLAGVAGLLPASLGFVVLLLAAGVIQTRRRTI